jgi:hypothetical protein
MNRDLTFREIRCGRAYFIPVEFIIYILYKSFIGWAQTMLGLGVY